MSFSSFSIAFPTSEKRSSFARPNESKITKKRNNKFQYFSFSFFSAFEMQKEKICKNIELIFIMGNAYY